MTKRYIDYYVDAVTAKSDGGGGKPAVLIAKTLTANGTYTAKDDGADGYKSVVVDVADGFPDVIFYDWDGQHLYEFTKDQFLALTEMPPLKTLSDDMKAQAWNWSFDGAQAYVAKYGACDIGALCATSKPDTVIKLLVDDYNLTETVTLYFTQSISEGVSVDFGDGTVLTSTSASANGTRVQHTYAAKGVYDITLVCADGCEASIGAKNYAASVMGLINAKHYPNVIALYVGSKFGSVGKGFTLGDSDYHASSLDTLQISEACYDFTKIELYNVPKLKHMNFPLGTTNIVSYVLYGAFALDHLNLPSLNKVYSNAFFNMYAIRSISFPEIFPLKNFPNMYALERLILPETITGLNGYIYAYSLKQIVIPKSTLTSGYDYLSLSTSPKLDEFTVHSDVVNLNRTLQANHSISRVVIAEGFDKDTLETGACYNMNGLEDVVVLTDSIKSFGSSCFYNCVNLKHVDGLSRIEVFGSSCFDACHNLVIDEPLANVKTIGNGCFRGCTKLPETFVFPASIQSIDNSAFQGTAGVVKTFDFSQCTSIPALGKSVFNNTTALARGTQILVPAALYDAWKSATNWSSWSQYIFAV